MSITRRPDGRWRARIRVDGREYAKHFDRKLDAQRWEDGEKAKLAMGTWTDPKTAQTTVADWCQTWLHGYGRRRNTVLTARTHVARITAEFGRYRLAAVRPSDVQRWTGKLKAEGLEPSYVRALYRRLAQIMAAAVDDGIIAKSPCSRRVSPPAGKQRSYVATTKQVWNLYDAFPPHLKVAILLGAFAGLRVGEACGLRPQDVDFEHRMIRPTVQWRCEPLKTDISQTAIPVPQLLLDELLAHMAQWTFRPQGGVRRSAQGARQMLEDAQPTVLVNLRGGQVSPLVIEKAMRSARAKVPGLPEGFRYHDLRHYMASFLIAAGCDVKTVQARIRHGSIKTTLDTYAHLWPDQDETTRAAVDAAMRERKER